MKSVVNQLKVVWKYTIAIAGISPLPTFWSNCLAGWWLGGDGNPGKLLCLLLGVTCLAFGGVFFKLVYHSEISGLRHICNIMITNDLDNRHWWLVSFGWCVLGLAILLPAGSNSTVLALLIILSSVTHGAVCRVVRFAPMLTGLTRVAIYLLAAGSGENGITGLSMWSALSVGFYVTGVGLLGSENSKRNTTTYWPCGFVLVPILLALAAYGFSRINLVLCSALLLWILVSLRYILLSQSRNLTYATSNMTTAIVLVDLLATGGESVWLILVLGLIFIAALLNLRKQPMSNPF
jgi:hypothetical protein